LKGGQIPGVRLSGREINSLRRNGSPWLRPVGICNDDVWLQAGKKQGDFDDDVDFDAVKYHQNNKCSWKGGLQFLCYQGEGQMAGFV
jgi:hypothetical protein